VTAAVVLPPSLFADAVPASGEGFGDEEEPVGVVPALAASVTPTPAADLPPAPPPPPAPRAWSPPAEQWVDLTDGAPAARANGGHAGEQAPYRPGPGEPAPYRPAAGEPAPGGHRSSEPAPSGLWPGERVPNGARGGQPVPNGAGNGNGDHLAPGGGDWTGWWEPSPDELRGGEPMSPLAARPPLSERVQASFSGTPSGAPLGGPSVAPPGPPPVALPVAPSGAPEPHPRMPGPPEREGSLIPEQAAPAVHSPPIPERATPAVHGSPMREQADGPMLSRRVPQAHLAPELRRSGQGPAAQPDGPLPDAAEARAALSRYQASRKAARAVVEEGVDPERPASGGWS
jgi:hypothetical protein